MTLGDIITRLESEDQNKIVPIGFSNPHSYRGYYHELAFEPKPNITVKECLDVAKSALDQMYQGWKGGDYIMNECSTVWFANEGESGGDCIGPVLMSYMLGTIKI